MNSAIWAGFLFALATLGLAVMGIRLYQHGRRAGRDQERSESLEATAEAARKGNAIDEDVKRLSDADLDRELRNPPRRQ